MCRAVTGRTRGRCVRSVWTGDEDHFPFAAGGSGDMLCRQIAQYLGPRLTAM